MNDQTKKNNLLGPVAREKYESILRDRVTRGIKALEQKIEPFRERELANALKDLGVYDDLMAYRATAERLTAVFERPYGGVWLGNDRAVLQCDELRDAFEARLQTLRELRPVYAELARLRAFESQIAEKVWLADAPSAIAALLEQIGPAE